MSFRWIKEQVTHELARADVIIGGDDPWDINMEDERFYSMTLWGGHSGFAKAYEKGYWNCRALDRCMFRLLTSGVVNRTKFHPENLTRYFSDRFLNRQSRGRAQKDVPAHYNQGAVFDVMLDSTMSYSCAYWDKAETLEEAQIAKIDLVCRKLGLKPGMKFCDIGCGWGGLVLHSATNFGCDSYGITVTSNQHNFIQEKIAKLPCRAQVRSSLTDYRNLVGEYDRIASVGVLDHIGIKNFPLFMRTVKDHLNDGGLFLLHTIGVCHSSPTLARPEVSWFEKNIFPGVVLPSLGQIISSADGLLKVLDVENFGTYYDRTLMEWASNFEKAWPGISHLYDDEFYRRWRYYLYACAAEFRSGRLDLYHIVFAKPEWKKHYEAIRPPESLFSDS